MSLLLLKTQRYAEAGSGWVEREWEVGAWRWGPKSSQEPRGAGREAEKSHCGKQEEAFWGG